MTEESQPLSLNAWGKSDVGNVRENNEDSYLVDAERGVFVVADGVGGRKHGEVASRMVAEATREAAGDLEAAASGIAGPRELDDRERVLELVRRHLEEVNTGLYEHESNSDVEQGMATTADMLVVSKTAAYVGHVGDSRVYLLRDDQIFRVTEDHTYAEQLRADSRADVRQMAEQNEKFEHMLTRSMGARPHVEVDALYLDVQPGDRFLLCTDGLTNYMSAQEILGFAQKEWGQALIDTLVEEAKQRGGRDNITVVIVGVEDDSLAEPRRHTQTIDTLRQVDFLEQLSLFKGLDARELIKVLRTVYERSCEAGEVILRQGEESKALYLIVEGEVALTVDGTEITRLTAGQHFGELALLDEEGRRAATATSVGDTLFLIIAADRFQRLTSQELEIGNKLLRNLLRQAADQLREMNQRLASTASKDTIRTPAPPSLSESDAQG